MDQELNATPMGPHQTHHSVVGMVSGRDIINSGTANRGIQESLLPSPLHGDGCVAQVQIKGHHLSINTRDPNG